MLTDFTTYYPTTVNKPVCCWSKNRPGVLSLSTIDILGPFILYCGGLSCGLYPIDAPSCDNHKCLQTRPNVPRGGKIAPVENFWDRHINQQNRMGDSQNKPSHLWLTGGVSVAVVLIFKRHGLNVLSSHNTWLSLTNF